MEREQRKYVRVRQRLTTLIKFLDSGKVLRALTRDISAGGICFVTERLLEPGTQLEIEVRLPDREQAIAFTAEVVRSRILEQPAKSYEAPTVEVGVKFITVDPKDHTLITQYAAMNPIPPELGG